jgi:adenylate cyclase
MLEEVNNVYSSEVINRVQAENVKAAANYADIHGAIPLPATLTIVLGQRISEKSTSGMQVRLYSDYPFRSRKDGGPKDDFERTALPSLRQDPDRPYWRFEDYQGRQTLRFAVARRMQETCIQCHNTHPDSTKADWKVGDVRGVVEIIRPLDEDIDRTHERLRGTFTLMAVISVSLLGLSVLVLVVGNRSRGYAPSQRNLL